LPVTIVDSTIWIDYFRGESNPHVAWLDRELGRQPLGLTDLILCEVLQGIRDDATFRRVRHHLSLFEIFETSGEKLAVAAARHYRSLRTQGITVRKTIDCLIAAFCLEYGHSLLHRDRDFDAFENHMGLQVVHP